MSIKTEVDELQSNVISLNTIRQEYISKLNSKGASLPNNASFVDIINGIYNLYCSTVKTFVHINFSDFPTGTGISDVEVNFRRIEIVRDAIFNALRTRNVELDNDITISDMVSKIDNIVSSPVYRMEPISVTTAEVSTVSTKVTINNYSGGEYKYAINDVYADDISYWQVINSKDTVVYCSATDSITIVKDNTIFFGTVNIVKPVDPTIIEVSFSYGAIENGTIMSINSTIPYTNVYYSLEPYTIHQAEPFYGNDPSGVRFDKWDWGEIRIEGGRDPKLYVVLTNDDNLVVGAGYGTTKCGFVANRLYISSKPGDEYGETILTVASVLSPGNMYRYYRGNKKPMYDEDISSLTTYGWNGTSPLFLNQAEMITVFEVTSNYKVRKYDNVIVSVKLHELGSIEVLTEVTEDEFNKCNINITTPKSNPGNSWYYKCGYDASLPSYGSDINSDYTKAPSSIFTVEELDGKKILVVEYNPTEKIVAAGSATIKSNKPYANLILLKSEIGSTLGYTKVTIVSPELTPGNVYLYTKGNAPVTYGTRLGSWFRWNGVDELTGFTEDDSITIAEAEPVNLELRNIGVVSANPRPLELLPLAVTSKAGSYAGYTMIMVNPSISDRRNEYRFAFNVHEPKLYDDASRWREWDGSTEIEVDEEYGSTPTIVIAECNPDHLVLKTGSAVVTIKEAEPKLKKLTISLTDGSTPEMAAVHVDATVIGTGWRYMYTYMDQVIDIDDVSNYHWDCSTWTQYITGEIPYNEGQRLYIAICTDNYAAEYMGTMIASKEIP